MHQLVSLAEVVCHVESVHARNDGSVVGKSISDGLHGWKAAVRNIQRENLQIVLDDVRHCKCVIDTVVAQVDMPDGLALFGEGF